LKEEKATLEAMVESRDELIMEIAKETGHGRMEEDAKDEEEDEDADDGGDAATAPVHAPPLLPHLRRSSRRKALWRWFLNKKPLWHMKSSWQMLSRDATTPSLPRAHEGL
jgi:hypothetical protein